MKLLIPKIILVATSSVIIGRTSATLLNKPSPLNHKQKLIKTMDDYSVSMLFSRTKHHQTHTMRGTGGFLDYEITKDNSYPTKGFLATNAHVVNKYTFPNDPYNQNIPTGINSESFFLYRWEGGGTPKEDPEIGSIHNPNSPTSIPPSRDAENTSKHGSTKPKTPLMHTKITNYKLLYAPIETKDNINLFKDFAVLEVNFPNEISAKRMTHQIINKPEKERINLIDDFNENSQLYSVGYPNNTPNPFKPFGNYSPSKDLASTNRGCFIGTNQKDFLWNGKNHKNKSCYYLLDNFKLGTGASGSMVIDEFGTLAGVNSLWDKQKSHALVQPIRKRSRDNTLEYDLILGSPNQQTSYRQQLLINLPNTNTYLKQKYNGKIV